MTTPTRAVNGAAVKVIRELTGISQRDLAARCQITQGHLSNVERGIFGGSVTLARQLAAALDVPLEAILYRGPAPEQVPA
jgi:putative transcriptional regulator